MATVELTEKNFEETIRSNDIVIVDFWAPWCAPCRSFAPIFESVSDNHSDIVFAKVNTDDQQMLGAHFHVRSIPTLMIFREQVILYQQPGMVGASQLEALIAKTRELDMGQVHEEVRKEQEKAQRQGG